MRLDNVRELENYLTCELGKNRKWYDDVVNLRFVYVVCVVKLLFTVRRSVKHWVVSRFLITRTRKLHEFYYRANLT